MKHHRIKTPPWTKLYPALALLILGAWTYPYFPKLGSPNELTRLYLTRAIVDDGTFSIDGPVKRYGPVTDMSRYQGRLYTDKAPGASLAAVPVYFTLKLLSGWNAQSLQNGYVLRWLRIMVSGLAAALSMLLLLGLLADMGIGQSARMFLAWAWGMGTVAFAYGGLFYGHGLCALWLLLAFWALMKIAKGSAPLWIALVAGLALGLALLTEYTSVLLIAPMGISALWLTFKRPRALLAGALGALLPLSLLAVYHQACFGAPWATGYAHLVNRHYAQVHEQGFMGLVTPSLHRLWLIVFASTRGLLFYSPWLVLGPVGMWSLLRSSAKRTRLVWLSVSAGFVLYMLFAMSLKIDAWGWSLGPRHLTPLLPFLTLGSAGALLAGAKAKKISWHLMGVAVPYSIVATVTPFVVFGGFPPDFTNPLADFIGPLLFGGCVAPNVASSLGLSAWMGLVPFGIAVGGLLAWMFASLPYSGWARQVTIIAWIMATVCAFSIRGENPPREQKALTWVQTDILDCK